MIDEFLVSFLTSDSSISGLAQEIAVGQVPVDDDGELLVQTYIWISNYDEEDELDLSGESGLTKYRFDIEACSLDDRTAKRLGRFLKKKLQGYGPGVFGEIETESGIVSGYVDAIFIESKDDDYVSTNQFTINELSVVAFDVMIVADDAQDDLESV